MPRRWPRSGTRTCSCGTDHRSSIGNRRRRSRSALLTCIDRAPTRPHRRRVRARRRSSRAQRQRWADADSGLVASPARCRPLLGQQLCVVARTMTRSTPNLPLDRPRDRRGQDPPHNRRRLPVDGRLRPCNRDLRERVGDQRAARTSRPRRHGARQPRPNPRPSLRASPGRQPWSSRCRTVTGACSATGRWSPR